MTTTAPMAEHQLADQAAPLDTLLIQAALGPTRSLAPNSSVAKWAAGMARRPAPTARRLADLGSESLRVAWGTSTLAPHRSDRRFTDPAWTENGLLRRVVQLYLASGRTAEQLLNDADLGWRDEQRARFLVQNLIEALSPSNLPPVNPSSAKAAIDTGGLSLLRGGTQFVKDMAAAPRIPVRAAHPALTSYPGKKVMVGLRPEHLRGCR